MTRPRWAGFLCLGDDGVFEKVPTDLSFLPREEAVLKLWKDKDIFRRSIAMREGCPEFTFYDGPPTANGKPHIGHVLTRAVKDIIPRYRTMKGYRVLRKAGWDTHGLPVELEVEKALGLDGKPQIEKYGVAPFIEKCKQSVWTYQSEWERMSERVGFWADMDEPYITYQNNYIESVWWSLKRVHEMGLLYKGHKVVPYCPRCGTALSSHEVSQGYKEVSDLSAFVRFAVKGRENTFLLAWTTTPWTLPSNVALAVNADEEYALVEHKEVALIMARALVTQVLGEAQPSSEADASDAYRILKTFPGADLAGMEYEPLYQFASVKEKAWYVVCDSYVTLTDGTGIVHTAPAFGEDDARLGRDNNLPFVQLVDAQGKFVAETPWSGLFVKEADPKILDELKSRGLLLKTEHYTHNYPFCWRCDTPLLYYARSTWFIRMTAVREKLMAFNRAVNWMPENIKEGRMGNFVDNVLDWGLSRERYWGTPLPVWLCECGHMHVVGSIEELCRVGRNVPERLELHKPGIDEIKLVCERCGGDMTRTPEVIDCWYDAGSMPFAQWHYPFENKEIFERHYPADFISEAIDQTRGWFYTLLAISTLLFDEQAFRNCIVLGHVQDKNGQKMSKHTGNVVDPFDALNNQGADAVRWYFFTTGAPWLPSRFYDEAVSEVQRKFMGTLWNTYAFFALYASIDGYDPARQAGARDFTLMDRYILSKLNSLIKFVDEGLANYEITQTSRAIQDFVDTLSNWYVRRCRERFWGKGESGDKLAAFETLYKVLTTLCGLIAPYTPFIAETMYQNLTVNVIPDAADSVHMTDFPTFDEAAIDAALEEVMQRVIEVVQLGRAARAQAGVKVRQPLSALYVRGGAGSLREGPLAAQMAALISDELNVKQVRFVEDAREFSTYRVKPQLRTLGPRYGKLLGKIGEYLAGVDGNAVVDAFDRGEPLRFEIEGTGVELARDDTLIEPTQKPGFVTAGEHNLVVVLDTRLDDTLIAEGHRREVISKLQTMRKEAGFEVTDRINVWYNCEGALAATLKAGRSEIMEAVLALSMSPGDAPDDAVSREWDINGERASLAVLVAK